VANLTERKSRTGESWVLYNGASIAYHGGSYIAGGLVSWWLKYAERASVGDGGAPFHSAGAGQSRTDADKPDGSTAITRGMGKEAVRTVWGEPEEIRKIRTCFEWQEEWVYRGDPKGGQQGVAYRE
jgi:hypothetical protein